MRTEGRLAEALWPRARRRILGLLMSHPDEEWHLRDLARRSDLAPATAQREVVVLTEAGVLRRRESGNQVYYSANRDCPIFSELQGIALKTVGLLDVVSEALAEFDDRIEVAFVFGSMAAGSARNDSDVDLMVVGDVGLRELVPALREMQRSLHREVNPVTITADEFAGRVADSEHFITTVLREPKMFVVGDEDELARLGAGGASAPA